jgi:hypothetical protein
MSSCKKRNENIGETLWLVAEKNENPYDTKGINSKSMKLSFVPRWRPN